MRALASASRCAPACRHPAARCRSRRRSPSCGVLPLGGSFFSCVPQPSSAGCRPSEMKPSTDQVLTKVPKGLGFLARCVSRSAMWMPLTPSRFISLAQPSRVLGSATLVLVSRGDVHQRLLHEPGHHAGIGPAAGDGGGAGAQLALQRQQPFAQHVVGAVRLAELGIVVEAGPRLDHRVDVERVGLAREPHDVEAVDVDREVDDEGLARARGQQRLQHLLVVLRA